MPVRKVQGGYQWGQSGRVYPTKAQAERQGRAVYASGYRGGGIIPVGFRRWASSGPRSFNTGGIVPVGQKRAEEGDNLQSGIARVATQLNQPTTQNPIPGQVAQGLASGLMGAPVDIASMAMRPFGYSVPPEKTVGSTEWWGSKMGADPTTTPFIAGSFGPFPDATDAMRMAAHIDPQMLMGLAGILKSTGKASEAASDAARVSRGVERARAAGLLTDDAGEPLTLFHGRTADYPDVKESFEASGGIFLTDSEDVAEIFRYPREYGEVVTEYFDEDILDYVPIKPGPVHKANVSMNNPLVLDEGSRIKPDDFIFDTALQTQVIRTAKEAGHDGIIVKGGKEGVGDWMEEGTTYVVFDKRQLVDIRAYHPALSVREGEVPNMSSISASLYNYEVLPGIRSVQIKDFETDPHKLFYAKDDIDHVNRLAQEIRESGEISPLIVVRDSDGPYILEGGHRLAALGELGVEEFPAIVVRDLD